MTKEQITTTKAAQDAAARFISRDDGDFAELAALFQSYGERIRTEVERAPTPKRKWAITGCGAAIVWFASVNLAYELGLDTALCLTEHVQTKAPSEDIPACQRAEPVKHFPAHHVRQVWLWLNADLVEGATPTNQNTEMSDAQA